MFPKLFGGGHAYLQLTGDELLSTGVSIMAQPPGKKNTDTKEIIFKINRSKTQTRAHT